MLRAHVMHIVVFMLVRFIFDRPHVTKRVLLLRSQFVVSLQRFFPFRSHRWRVCAWLKLAPHCRRRESPGTACRDTFTSVPSATGAYARGSNKRQAAAVGVASRLSRQGRVSAPRDRGVVSVTSNVCLQRVVCMLCLKLVLAVRGDAVVVLVVFVLVRLIFDRQHLVECVRVLRIPHFGAVPMDVGIAIWIHVVRGCQMIIMGQLRGLHEHFLNGEDTIGAYRACRCEQHSARKQSDAHN